MLSRSLRTHLPLVSEMDRLFESFVPTTAVRRHRTASGATFPAINVWEHDDHIAIEAELPGLAIEDIELTFEEGRLVLAGSFDRTLPEGTTLLRQERVAGAFERVIELATPIDPDRTEATLLDGVLTVKLPKTEASRPRRSEIRAEG